MNLYPGFDQRIVIETWHKGVTRLFGLRDFRVMYANNQELAVSTSAWLVLDKKTGRPVKPDGITKLNITKTEHHAIKEMPDKIEPPEDPDTEKLIEPGYTDFDINQHVNAGRYIEWIQDLYPPDFYKKYQISEFRINYLNETRFNEKIRIFSNRESIQNREFSKIEGRISSTDTPAFRANLHWIKI